MSRKDQSLERVGPVENLDVAPGRRWRSARRGLLSLVWLVGLYALAVGVALIVALRLGAARGEDCKVT